MQFPQFQAHAALEGMHWWFTGRREIVRTILHQLFPPGRERSIVDIGCGTGGNTVALHEEYACIGIDPDPDAIALARARFPHCRFIHGAVPQAVPEEIRKADVLLLLDVLEHVQHDAQFLQELVAAMRPGAYLFIMVPADPALWSPHDEGFGHFRRYTLESLRFLWQEQPVRELLLSPCNVRLYWPIRFLRLFAKARGKSLGQGNSDLALPPFPFNAFLRWVFAGEAKRLSRVLAGQRKPWNRHGVSAIAILERRENADCEPRCRRGGRTGRPGDR